MKRLLIPLLSALALTTAGNANIDPRIIDISVAAHDYKGFIELNTEMVTLPKCNSSRKDNCTGEN